MNEDQFERLMVTLDRLARAQERHNALLEGKRKTREKAAQTRRTRRKTANENTKVTDIAEVMADRALVRAGLRTKAGK